MRARKNAWVFALWVLAGLLGAHAATAYKPTCRSSTGAIVQCSGTLDNTQAPTSIAASSLTGTVAQANGGLGVDASALSNGVVVKSGGAMATATAPTMSGANITAGTVPNASLANSSLTVTASTGLSGGGAVSLGGSTALSVAYGATAGTAAEGNDARLMASPTFGTRGIMCANGTNWVATDAGTANRIVTSSASGCSWSNFLNDIIIDANVNSLSNVGTSMLASGFNLAANQGGTGFTSYTVGDVLAANTTSTLSKVSASTSGYIWTSNGAGVLPSYQAPVTATNSCASMSAGSYALTTSYGNIGLSLSLGAGTHIVTANVRTQIQATAGTLNAGLRLYNSTAGSAIANSDRFTNYSSGNLEGQTTPITEIITLGSTSTIDVQGLKSAGTFTSATVNSDSSGYSRLCAVKISS